MKRFLHPILFPVLLSLVACSSEEATDPGTTAPASQGASQAPATDKGASTAEPQSSPKARAEQAAKTNGTQTKTRLGALSTDPSGEMRSLVPADAYFWAELESIDRLGELMSEVGALMEGVPMPPPEMMLSSLTNFGIDPDQVRSDAPLGVAISMGPGMEPAPTFIINVRNAASLAAKLQGAPGMPTPRASGNAVAIPLHESYVPDAEHGSMMSSDLPKGSLAFRVHMSYLTESMGEQIKQGMMMAKTMANSGAQSTTAAALLENQMDQGAEVLENMRFLSMGIDLDGGNLDMTFAMEMEPTSPFAELGSGGGRDLAELTQYIGQEDSLVILGSLNRDHMDQFVRPTVDGIALNTGYDEGIQMRAAYSGMESLLGQDGTSFAIVAHVDKRSTDVSAFLQGIDSEVATDQLCGVLDGFTHLGDSLVATEPIKGNEHGSQFLQYDFVPTPEAVTTAKGREDLANLESVFGASRARIRAVTQDDEAMITLGEGTSLAAKAVHAEGNQSPEMEWALNGIQGRSPAMLYRMDVNRMNHGMARCADGNGYMAPVASAYAPSMSLEEVPPFFVTCWMVLEDNLWEGGLRLDLKAAAELGQRSAGAFGPVPR